MPKPWISMSRIIVGSNGNETLDGGAGDDTILGQGGGDLIIGGRDSLASRDINNTIDVADLEDKTESDDGNDTLYGGGGNDDVSGGKGNDLLAPGRGRDTVNGNNGNDTLSYEDVSSSVRINISQKKYGGAAANDTIKNVDNIIGSQDGDQLTPAKGGYAYGKGGSDVIKSAGGAVMRGDEGSDKLVGSNKGKDVFWLQPAEYGADKVFNFKGSDQIRLKGSDFDIGGSLAGSELVNRSSGHDASGGDAQLIYDQASNTLWFDPDGTGGAGAEKIATFKKGAPGSLSTGDFDIV
jgi:Ca2+-binding RTX toxin-like protein